MRALIIGAGFLGSEILSQAAPTKMQILGARRNPPDGDNRYIPLDVLKPESLSAIPDSIDYIVYAVSSSDSGCEGYVNAYVKGIGNVCAHLKNNLAGSWSGKMLFVSSTGVYEEDSGAEVYEDSKLADNVSYRSDTLIEGEKIVREAFPEGQHVIARLSGIYGAGRSYMIDQARKITEPLINDSYTNRIHKTDGARAIIHLLQQESAHGTYIVSDKEPALRSTVISYLRETFLGLPALAQSVGAVSSLQIPSCEGKRCNSSKLQSTGFEFLYPTYREGYQSYFGGEGEGCQ